LSLVEEWAGFIRRDYPDATREMDIEAFADGHIKGYSVVAEVAANMEEASRIAFEAWDKILVSGQARVDIMKEAARAIDEAQKNENTGGCATC
jgi:hypothetical protein